MPRCLPALLALTVILSLAAPVCAQKAPTTLAGITLGADAENLRDRLDISRMAPIWNRPWLIRANLKPTKGFEAGYVILGGCATTNRVMRVRLLYADGSLAAFDKLVKGMTVRYGVPTPLPSKKSGKYKGYRWVFGSNKTKGVDVLLEHFGAAVDDGPKGNVIRLSDNRAIANEKACYDSMVRGAPEPQPAFPLFSIDQNWLLPQ
ncbi:conserved hypothetical protein [Solidesulfovibrio fructosivorans JJ]]|uniref:Uncharacterized protein n=1 Tax=Solidesulfovibrio fructosivorans JJ] TaxID=596151 RepID=E1K0H8_SOLFR|nr:hypothetical protein [Solidesulfovibrio fructosivorans]EFL49921.1 conserved hypothetical protein [Solidesulfovibrio fructosivorans JJ]]